MKYFKRQISLLAAIAVIAIPTIAQTIQYGIVQEYRMWNKKKPLAGVEIDVKYAGSTISNKKGEFTLQFNILKPGARVSVNQIEKSGYEIFNKDAVNQWNLSSDGRPFTIIMARSKDMKNLRDNYSTLSSASYKKQREKEYARLNQELRDGKIKQQEYEKQLKTLEDWYKAQLGNINTYVDHFARFDLSELSAEEAAIIRLVQQGDFDEAIRRYDFLNPSGKYKQCVQNINEMDNAIHLINDAKLQEEMKKDSAFASSLHQVEVLRIAGGRRNFEKIDTILSTMALADSTDLRCNYTYADYLSEQKVYDEALFYYRRCLLLANDSLTISQMKAKIGLLELELGHFNESQEALLASRNILQGLSQHNQGYSKYYAQSINNIAKLYADMRDYNKAEESYLQALEQYQQIEQNGDSCTLEILTLKNDLGHLYYDKLDFDKAINILTAAYEPIRQMYGTNPRVYKPLMAQVEHNLGMVNRKYLNYDIAESHYRSSFSIYQDLYNHNPSSYRKSLAWINGDMSSLYERIMDQQQSQEYLNRAIAYYDTLLVASTDAALPSFARMQINLMNLYLENKEYEAIEPIIEKTYHHINSLYESYPRAYRSDLCDVLSILGSYYTAHKQYKEAKSFFERAKTLSDTLCSEDAASYLYQRLKTLNNLAGISSLMNIYQEDSIYTHMAYDVCRTLFEINPVVSSPHMAIGADNMSIYYFQSNNFLTAKKYSDEAEKIFESLYAKHPLIFGNDYIKALYIAARLSDHLNDTTGYESYVYNAYELSKVLYQTDPRTYREIYVKCLGDLSLHLLTTNIDQSLAYRVESLEITREMYQKEPEVYVKTMAEMYLGTSVFYKYAKDYTKSMAMIDSALVIITPFYEREPQAFRSNVALCLFNKGNTANISIGDKDLAIDCYKKALPLLQTEMERANALGKEAVAKDYLDYVQTIHLQLYIIYKDRKAYQEAIEQLNEMLLLEPDDEGVKQEIIDLESLISHN